jgi:hypothetical protein
LVSLILICTLSAGCRNSKPGNTDINEASTQKIETDASKDIQKRETAPDKNPAPAETQLKNITQEDAVELVTKVVGPIAKGSYVSFDHEGIEDNVEYYVIHYYEIIIDDPKTGVGHTATFGWYFVDKANGDVYEMDIATGKLKKPALKPTETLNINKVS